MRIPDMPFVIRVLAPFVITLEAPWDGPPLAVDASNMDQVMASLGISTYIPMPRQLCPEGGIDIRVARMKDFHPDTLIKNTPFLNSLHAAGELLSDPRLPAAEKRQGLEKFQDLSELHVSAEAKDATPKDAGALDNILSMVAMPGDAQTPGSQKTMQPHEGTAAGILQAALDRVYSDAAFRGTEAAWRGLKLLLGQGAREKGDFRVEIIPANLDTLQDTIAGMTAGQINDLPSLIVVDLPFDNTPHSIGLLENVARFAEILMAPALVWASSRLLELDSWADLDRLPFLPNYLDSAHFAKFNRLKTQSEANWLVVSCNRLMARHPYGSENRPKTVSFEERDLPWVSPVWAVCALIVKSLGLTGWPTRLTDWQRVRVDDLPVYIVGRNTAIPSEVLFSENRVDQLRRAGMTPVAAAAGQDFVFIPMETTLGGASLAYQLFASRMTHFTLWCRDNLPADLSGPALEDALKQAFHLFWEKSGHSGPESIEITAGLPDTEGRIPLHIDLKPSRQILSSGEGLTLEFSW